MNWTGPSSPIPFHVQEELLLIALEEDWDTLLKANPWIPAVTTSCC
jgi:hypothetical protein